MGYDSRTVSLPPFRSYSIDLVSGIAIMNIPINELSGSSVDGLRSFQRVVVLGSADSNDSRSLQA